MTDNSYFRRLAERELMARCIYGEARGESRQGKIAIAHVILNRVRADIGNDGKPDWWGEGIHGVILKPCQFSCFNEGDPNRLKLMSIDPANHALIECRVIAGLALANLTTDPTHGATHYHTVRIAPGWARKMIALGRVGNHLFYRER